MNVAIIMAIVALVLAVLAVPVAVGAQPPPQPYRIGVLFPEAGRWSRLFVPAVLAAAEVAAAHRILDVATGPAEAAAMALAQVGPSGRVVGADISVAMLDAANTTLADRRFGLW